MEWLRSTLSSASALLHRNSGPLAAAGLLAVAVLAARESERQRAIARAVTEAQRRAEAAPKEKLSASNLVSLLDDVREGAAVAVEEVLNALRVAGERAAAAASGDEEGAPARNLALEVAARARVQERCAKLQEAALKKRHCSQAEVEQALAYYASTAAKEAQKAAARAPLRSRSSGAGPEDVLAAALRLKVVIGRYFLTKQRVLDAVTAGFHAEVRARLSVASLAMVRNLPPRQVVESVQTADAQLQVQRECEAAFLRETGMTPLEVDRVTKLPEWQGDEAFVREFLRLHNEVGPRIMNEANENFQRRLQEYAMRQQMEMGAGGGGDGGGEADADYEDDDGELHEHDMHAREAAAAARGGGGGGGGGSGGEQSQPSREEMRAIIMKTMEFAQLPASERAKLPPPLLRMFMMYAEQLGIPLAN